MNYLKKIGKILGSAFLSILVLGLILSTLYYFDLINNNVYNISKMLIVLISLFTYSYLLGKHSEKYGLIEGLKLGAFFLIIMILIKIIINDAFNIRTIIYIIIILLTTGIGGVLGINKKEKK